MPPFFSDSWFMSDETQAKMDGALDNFNKTAEDYQALSKSVENNIGVVSESFNQLVTAAADPDGGTLPQITSSLLKIDGLLGVSEDDDGNGPPTTIKDVITDAASAEKSIVEASSTLNNLSYIFGAGMIAFLAMYAIK